jgi:hypothetical protein
MRKSLTCFVLIFLFGLAAGLPLAAQSGEANPSNTGSASAPSVSAQGTNRSQKLVLKDGSVQVVREYQVIGDRVRFYSIERSDWEEIPASLVDWDATRKAASQVDQRAKQAIALAHRVDLEEHPGSLDVDGGLADLPPGVLLPPGDGMFAFNGHAVVSIKANLAESKLDKGRFLAKMISPIPVVATRHTISLEGKRAKLQIADSEPIFFFRTDHGAAPQFLLIRTEVKGNRREIAYLSQYMGQSKTEANEIPLNVAAVDSDTYRVMAGQDLAPGEYVLAQPLDATTIDLYVWDFGIEPARKPSSKK